MGALAASLPPMCALPMEAFVRDALQPQEDFDQFLQGLMVDTTKKLEEIRAGGAEMGNLTAVDHPATAPTLLRRPLRAAAEKPTDPEQEWREQVKQRKAHERQCRMEEAFAAAAAAAELAGRPAHVAELTGEEAQLARARALWAAEAKVREGARASEAAAQREQKEQWRAAEWEPLLAQRREDLRAKREEAERCYREETSAAAQALQRERCAMVAEDTTGKSFRRTVAAECERRAAAGAPLERDQAVFVDVKAVLRMRRSELLHQDALEEQKAKAEQKLLREQEMQKECEYREWRQHVRAERCLQQVQKDLAPPRAADIPEPRRPDPQDAYRERELEQRLVLEASVRSAAEKASLLKARGGSPRQALEEARRRAELQRHQKAEVEPQKLEQELWDAMLAKNRLAARKQDSAIRTPRWGVFPG